LTVATFEKNIKTSDVNYVIFLGEEGDDTVADVFIEKQIK